MGALLLGGALLALAVVVAMPPAAAHAASGRAITIDGRGFAHGRGMGQWGARGMASYGKSWQQILRHYYPATTLKRRAAGERIRVLVASGETLVVSSVKRFRIQWADGSMIGDNDPKRRFVRVRFANGRYVLEKSRYPWGPWKALSRSRRGVVFVRGREPLEVVARSGAGREYRGTIEIRKTGGSLAAINHLPLEEYLFGVVPREMPSSWPQDALRAQAVAARSYAVALKDRAKGRAYDICATTACQVYGGRASRARPASRAVILERASTNAAVLATARTILTWKGRPVIAEYSSSTGGVTAEGKLPYLRSVRDPADRVSPHHSWRVVVGARRIERAFAVIRTLHSVNVQSRDAGKRVRLIRLSGSKRTVDVPGGTFASRLGLRSRLYSIRQPARYRFTTDFGYGSTGRHVVELQRRLRAEGVFHSAVNGRYGPATREAVRRYQSSRKIRTTGYVGPATRAALNRS
jgi:SpoIID/LytB domain protein